MSYREVLRLLEHSRGLDFPVVDDEGRLIGLISLQEFGALKFEPELHDTVLAKDFAVSQHIALKPSDSLQTALEAFAEADRDELPVISDDETRKLVGTLRRQDLLNAYERALVARRALK
jgi:CIC family chloride channel protein